MSDARNKQSADPELKKRADDAEEKRVRAIWFSSHGSQGQQLRLESILGSIETSLVQDKELSLEVRNGIAQDLKKGAMILAELDKNLVELNKNLVELELKSKKLRDKPDKAAILKAKENQEAMKKNQEAMIVQNQEFKKRLEILSVKFKLELKLDDAQILGERSNKTKEFLAQEQTTHLLKSLNNLFSMTPPEPTRGWLGTNSHSTTMPLDENQAKEIKYHQLELSALYTKYNKSGEIGPLTPKSLPILKSAVNKNQKGDKDKIEEYQELEGNLNLSRIKMFNHLYTIVPYSLLDEKIRNSNNFPDIVEEYIRVYQMNLDIEQRPGAAFTILRPEGHNTAFEMNFTNYQNSKNIFTNRQEQLRFYQYRDELRNLINGFEVKNVQKRLDFMPVQKLSSSDRLGSHVSPPSGNSPLSPKESGSSEPNSTFDHKYMKGILDKASHEIEIVISSKFKRGVPSLKDLEELKKEEEKSKQKKIFQNLLLNAYHGFEEKTLSLIKKKVEIYTSSNSSSLFKKPVQNIKLEFYQNVLENYNADENKDKSIKTHWDSLASVEKYKVLHKESSFNKLNRRVHHTSGWHPKVPKQQATPKDSKNNKPGRH